MVATSLLTTLLFASSIVAELVFDRLSRKPGARLSFSKRLNLTPSTSSRQSIVENDRRRISSRVNSRQSKALETDQSQGCTGNPESIVVANRIISYVAMVGVGSPPQNFFLEIDSGSSNTWVGANSNNTYKKTKTSRPTGDSVASGLGFVFTRYYVLSHWTNSLLHMTQVPSPASNEFIDQVTLGPCLVIPDQLIGVANSGFSNPGFDGILGIGPNALNNGTLSSNGSKLNTTFPTVTDSLFSAGTIPNNLVAVSFEPPNSSNLHDGELTWGGTDSSRFIGNITYSESPLTTENSFWNINASFSYGCESNVLLENTNCVVDTETSLFFIPADAFSIYQNATGAALSNSSVLTVTPDQFKKLPSIFITFSGTQLELTPDAQIWPRHANSLLVPGASSDEIFLVVGNSSAFGIEIPILGQAVLERFYTVFDTANRRVGFANTAFTNATTNFNLNN